MARVVVWFSCGVASAVAAKLRPGAVVVYCETGSEHPDNARFLRDCEVWLVRRVERIRSEKYGDTWDVWERRFIDEIPADWPVTEAIQPACDFLCYIAEQDLNERPRNEA